MDAAALHELELPLNTTDLAVVKRKFMRWALRLHPDKHMQESQEAQNEAKEEFIKKEQAYAKLMEAQKACAATQHWWQEFVNSLFRQQRPDPEPPANEPPQGQWQGPHAAHAQPPQGQWQGAPRSPRAAAPGCSQWGAAPLPGQWLQTDPGAAPYYGHPEPLRRSSRTASSRCRGIRRRPRHRRPRLLL